MRILSKPLLRILVIDSEGKVPYEEDVIVNGSVRLTNKNNLLELIVDDKKKIEISTRHFSAQSHFAIHFGSDSFREPVDSLAIIDEEETQKDKEKNSKELQSLLKEKDSHSTKEFSFKESSLNHKIFEKELSVKYPTTFYKENKPATDSIRLIFKSYFKATKEKVLVDRTPANFIWDKPFWDEKIKDLSKIKSFSVKEKLINDYMLELEKIHNDKILKNKPSLKIEAAS